MKTPQTKAQARYMFAALETKSVNAARAAEVYSRNGATANAVRPLREEAERASREAAEALALIDSLPER